MKYIVLYVFALFHSCLIYSQSVGITNSPSSKGVIIGTTYYDLQTNASVARRLINHGDGTLSAVWTIDNNSGASFPNRGTGYNYFDGNSWMNSINTRIEDSVRTGWPNIGVLGNGQELIITHNPQEYDFWRLTNSFKGDTAWTEMSIRAGGTFSGDNTIWGRMGIGGPDGNTVHLISNFANTANVILEGVANPIVYSRSLDGGITWPISGGTLPGFNSARYDHSGADQYDIDVDSNIVAIVWAQVGSDVVLWKSTDNGTTFTKTLVDSFPDVLSYFSIWEDNSELAEDILTIPTNDQSVSVIIDKNGIVHITYGYSEVYENANYEYYRTRSLGLRYWNENSDTVITVPVLLEDIDENKNGVYEIGSKATELNSGGARYNRGSVLTKPSIAMDNNGYIYIVFSLPADADTTDDTYLLWGQSFRDIWVVTSMDMGSTWGPVLNMTKTKGIEEAFACAAKLVDDILHIMYQEDTEPGTELINEDQNEIQYIKYLAIPSGDIVLVPEFTNSDSCGVFVVDFQDATSKGNPISWEWTFKDTLGNILDTSTIQNPTITFPAIGDYYVTLKCTSSLGYYYETTKIVSIAAIAPGADFDSPEYPYMMTPVAFKDFSSDFPNEWSWSVDDSTVSTDQNPSIFFSDSGKYKVCLISENDCGSDSMCRFVTITCRGAIADFYTIIIGGDVTYKNLTEYEDSLYWIFNNDSIITIENPVYYYTDTGTYSVCLIAWNDCKSDTTCKNISISCVKPFADYAYSKNELTVSFNNLSRNGTKYLWDFGHGVQSSLEDPEHTFPGIGWYDVCLTVTNYFDCDTSTKCERIDFTTSVIEQKNNDYRLSIMPNPYTESALITYKLKKTAEVSLVIYNLLGKKITTLANDSQQPNEYSYRFSAAERGCTPGIYLLKLIVNDRTAILKMVEMY